MPDSELTFVAHVEPSRRPLARRVHIQGQPHHPRLPGRATLPGRREARPDAANHPGAVPKPTSSCGTSSRLKTSTSHSPAPSSSPPASTPPDSEPDSTARTSSSPTPNSAGGSGKSSDTKPPNEAWSSCSTTWPDAYWVCPYARGCRSQSVCAPFLCLNGGAGSRWVPLQHPAQRARRAVTSQAAEPSRTPSGVSCAANSARRFAAAAARCASSAPSRSQADWPSCHLVP